ncbi:dicentracin-like [Seriola lalandi dorsalis]|uniref:Dicentracin-like n=1 Tax=Seriola lalandi dorsalis TaxID=1841481 RepID=A0A3B4WQ13_SERLL|nr:dicentracin-like [Seriola lalandi dorsalis]
MKFIALFLVLSLVVLMAEPGEGFFHHILSGIFHVGKMIHGAIQRRRHGMKELEQEQFDRDRADFA